MAAMTKRLWCYEDTVHGPTEAKVSAVETDLAENIQTVEDRTEETQQKLKKEIKEDLLQVLWVQSRCSLIRGR